MNPSRRNPGIRRGLAAVAAVFPLLGCAGPASAGTIPESSTMITVYPSTPGAEIDGDFVFRAGGKAIPLERHRVFRKDNRHGFALQSSRARFAVDGPFRFELAAPGRDPIAARIFGVGHDRDLPVRDGKITGRLPGPGAWVLKVRLDPRGEKTLFLWADDARKAVPDPSAPEVIDVTARGAVSSRSEDQTRLFQSLLDECASRPGGGTIYLPAGVYRTGTLRIGSNTTLWLAPGALLRGVDDPDAFPGQPEGNRRLLFVEGAENVRLAGRGTIDGNGLLLRNELGLRVQDVDVTSSRDVVLEDLLFRNAGSWCLHLLYSDNVRVSDVKVLSDHDAIDPDACRDVLIERMFAQSGDDAVAVKVTGNSGLHRSCERIVVRDGLFSTIKTALKCGTENRAPIRDVLFENCRVFDSSRGIAIWAKDGFDYERVTFRRIRMNLIPVPGEERSGEVFRFCIEKRRGLANLVDCLAEEIEANVFQRLPVYGHPEEPLRGLTLRRIDLRVEEPKNPQRRDPLFLTAEVADLRIDGFTVRWNGHRDLWDGILSEDASGIRVENVTEIP